MRTLMSVQRSRCEVLREDKETFLNVNRNTESKGESQEDCSRVIKEEAGESDIGCCQKTICTT